MRERERESEKVYLRKGGESDNIMSLFVLERECEREKERQTEREREFVLSVFLRPPFVLHFPLSHIVGSFPLGFSL